MHAILIATLAAAFAASHDAARAETPAASTEPTGLEAAPAPLRAAAEAAVPGATLTAMKIDTSGPAKIYEFAGVDEKGRKLEVDVREDGSIEEIERPVGYLDTPGAAQNALEKAEPRFALTRIIVSLRDGDVRVYEYEGVVDGKKMKYEIAGDGTILSTLEM